jgi:hypothetical protein
MPDAKLPRYSSIIGAIGPIYGIKVFSPSILIIFLSFSPSISAFLIETS